MGDTHLTVIVNGQTVLEGDFNETQMKALSGLAVNVSASFGCLAGVQTDGENCVYAFNFNVGGAKAKKRK